MKGMNAQNITVSAAVRLIPRPPARVLRQNTNMSGLVISYDPCLFQAIKHGIENQAGLTSRLIQLGLSASDVWTYFVCQAVTISLL